MGCEITFILPTLPYHIASLFFNVFQMAWWYYFSTFNGMVSAVIGDFFFSKAFSRLQAREMLMTSSALTSQGRLPKISTQQQRRELHYWERVTPSTLKDVPLRWLWFVGLSRLLVVY